MGIDENIIDFDYDNDLSGKTIKNKQNKTVGKVLCKY